MAHTENRIRTLGLSCLLRASESKLKFTNYKSFIIGLPFHCIVYLCVIPFCVDFYPAIRDVRNTFLCGFLPCNRGIRKKWIEVLPPREGFTLNPSKFFICENHWPSDTPMIALPGGHTRPRLPPSIFNVPISCLPTPKPPPRQPKDEDRQLKMLMKKDKITSKAKCSQQKQCILLVDEVRPTISFSCGVLSGMATLYQTSIKKARLAE